jgi:hypothetical protein
MFTVIIHVTLPEGMIIFNIIMKTILIIVTTTNKGVTLIDQAAARPYFSTSRGRRDGGTCAFGAVVILALHGYLLGKF